MENKNIRFVVAFLVFFIFGPNSFSSDPEDPSPLSAKEIVRRCEERYVGKDMVSLFEVSLTNSSGQVRKRGLLRYRKDFGGLSKDLLKFVYPNDIKDVTTLNEEVIDGEDIQYLYLPAAKKLRRVSAKNQSWAGTDYVYEDLEELNLDDWDYQLLGSEIVNGYDSYVVELTARAHSKSMYSKRRYFVRKDGSFYADRLEWYDKKGRFLKSAMQTDVKNVDGALYATYMKVRNVQDDHQTVFRRLWIRINTDMPVGLLTTRQIEKPIESYDHPVNMWHEWKRVSMHSPS